MTVQTHEDFSRAGHQASKSTNREFGFVMSAACAVVALWPLRTGQPLRLYWLVAGGIFLVLAATRPALLEPLNRAWTALGRLLGLITTPIVVGILFFLAFTPFGIVRRRIGKDTLRLRRDPQAKSYWIERNPPGPEPQSMSRQF